MLLKRVFYGIQCDRCGKIQNLDSEGNEVDNDAGGVYEIDEDAALEVARMAEWSIYRQDERHYCKECAEIMEMEA